MAATLRTLVFGLLVRWIIVFIRFLEEMVIRTLAEYGLKAERSKGETGVWLDVGTPFARKICAMGVRASRWVTMHGFALNVNADLGYFDNMIPCGIKGKAVTSLNVELGKTEVDIAEVKEKLLKHFAQSPKLSAANPSQGSLDER